MKKYVFIKDEGYSSNLYTNFTEYLSKDDDLKCSFMGSDVYKIKLMITEEAEDLCAKHPMMMKAKRVSSSHGRNLSLVSFGGCVFEVPVDKMIYQAKLTGSSTLISFAPGNNEADILYEAEALCEEKLKERTRSGFIYLSLVHLEDTDIYYMILNPTLVQATGHIELPGDPWIEQIKGVKDTVKDSIFSMWAENKIAGHILSPGPCTIDVLKNSIIQPEDRAEFLEQLDFFFIYKDGPEFNTSHQIKDGKIKVFHSGDVPIRISVENKLLGNYINDGEKLKWEYIISS